MEIVYKPSFLRQLKALPASLQTDTLERIEAFKDPKNHTRLRTHPLKGKLRGYYSFSVNYRFRIVFQLIGKGKKLAVLIGIGDHAVYD